jgi:hypothetical protein
MYGDLYGELSADYARPPAPESKSVIIRDMKKKLSKMLHQRLRTPYFIKVTLINDSTSYSQVPNPTVKY